jgi:hypothetical protein
MIANFGELCSRDPQILQDCYDLISGRSNSKSAQCKFQSDLNVIALEDSPIYVLGTG